MFELFVLQTNATVHPNHECCGQYDNLHGILPACWVYFAEYLPKWEMLEWKFQREIKHTFEACTLAMSCCSFCPNWMKGCEHLQLNGCYNICPNLFIQWAVCEKFVITYVHFYLLALSCPSIHPRISAQLPLNIFPWNLILGTYLKICQENQDLVKLGKNIGLLTSSTHTK